MGDYLFLLGEVSFLLYVVLVRAYDRGAYYFEKYYVYFIESFVLYLRSRLCCELRLEIEVESILMDGKCVIGVRIMCGEMFWVVCYVSNVDLCCMVVLFGARGW